MHVHSAHHLDTPAVPQPFLSIELVSRSSRSSVHVCRFSDMLQSRAYCLKTLRADGRYLEHQRSLLARLVAGSRKAASEERGAGAVASRRAANGETASGDTEERGVTAFGARFAATGVLRDSRLRPSHGKWLYLVSAWAEGAPLSRIITQRARERRPLLLADSLSLLLAVATDLHDLGRCGGSGAALIHQDLKPSNIIVSPSPVERATVIDLDTAFFLGEPTDAVPCGSYGYTAPEGIMRTPGWDNENLDVFSFGIVAHEVLTGRWPYPFPPRLRDDFSFWSAYFRGGGVPRVDPCLPDDVRQLVRSCVALDPGLRPSSSELIEQVGRLAALYAGSGASCPLAAAAAPLPTPASTAFPLLDLPPDEPSNSVAQ